MFFKKGIFILLVQLLCISHFSLADDNTLTAFKIDIIMDEYGSIIDHIEIFLDKQGNKTNDEIINGQCTDFRNLKDNVEIDKN
jgi:hypothetical protein